VYDSTVWVLAVRGVTLIFDLGACVKMLSDGLFSTLAQSNRLHLHVGRSQSEILTPCSQVRRSPRDMDVVSL
jgi:hypothetical protein